MIKNNILNLENRNAIVTGGGGILGRGFSNILSEYGANVAVLDLDLDNAKLTVSEVKNNNSNTNLVPLYCDVSNPKSVQEAVDQVVNIFGNIDILVNNAATKTNNLDLFLNSFEDYDLDTWREVMSVNIDGIFLMSQAVGKKMLTQSNGGSIVQTASIYGLLAPDQRIYEGSEYLGKQVNSPAVYAASKAAVIGLTKYLASYWGNKKIRVNSICPGDVEGNMMKYAIKKIAKISNKKESNIYNNYISNIPLKRFAKPSEIADACFYLSNSKYITGTTHLVDGGENS